MRVFASALSLILIFAAAASADPVDLEDATVFHDPTASGGVFLDGVTTDILLFESALFAAEAWQDDVTTPGAPFFGGPGASFTFDYEFFAGSLGGFDFFEIAVIDPLTGAVLGGLTITGGPASTGLVVGAGFDLSGLPDGTPVGFKMSMIHFDFFVGKGTDNVFGTFDDFGSWLKISGMDYVRTTSMQTGVPEPAAVVCMAIAGLFIAVQRRSRVRAAAAS